MTTQQIIQQEMFGTIYQKYREGLSRYALWKINDASLSQDLVQNTFLKAWNYFVKGGNVYSMKSFLYHILNNLIIDEYRKHKTESLDTLIEKKGIEELNTNDHEHLPDILDGRASTALIAELPEKLKNVVYLRFLKDMSLTEISAITGQSKNTVAVQAHRGLKKLKSLYNNNYLRAI